MAQIVGSALFVYEAIDVIKRVLGPQFKLVPAGRHRELMTPPSERITAQTAPRAGYVYDGGMQVDNALVHFDPIPTRICTDPAIAVELLSSHATSRGGGPRLPRSSAPKTRSVASFAWRVSIADLLLRLRHSPTWSF